MFCTDVIFFILGSNFSINTIRIRASQYYGDISDKGRIASNIDVENLDIILLQYAVSFLLHKMGVHWVQDSGQNDK